MPASAVIVGGLKTSCLGRPALTRRMVEECFAARKSNAKPKLIFTTNGHSISLAATDPQFRSDLDAADLIHADGQPAVLASRWLTKTPITGRSCTTDFIHDAADAAVTHGLKFFLLGSTEEINRRAAEALLALHPGLQIAGRRHGYFKRDDEAAVCAEINASGADIVWVGLGVPFEQAFCVRNKFRLTTGWMVTSGGCFNFLAGDYRRAPDWMQKTALEWLYRLWREPRRLFWRYAVTNPHALYLMLTRTHEVAAPSGAAARRVPDALTQKS